MNKVKDLWTCELTLWIMLKTNKINCCCNVFSQNVSENSIVLFRMYLGPAIGNILWETLIQIHNIVHKTEKRKLNYRLPKEALALPGPSVASLAWQTSNLYLSITHSYTCTPSKINQSCAQNGCYHHNLLKPNTSKTKPCITHGKPSRHPDPIHQVWRIPLDAALPR